MQDAGGRTIISCREVQHAMGQVVLYSLRPPTPLQLPWEGILGLHLTVFMSLLPTMLRTKHPPETVERRRDW